MNAVFADTFYFVALISPDDDSHNDAVEMSHEIFTKVVTTEYVLMEVADAMAGTRHRAKFQSVYDLMANDPKVEIVCAQPGLFKAGLHLYSRYTDKEWSLTDCISFQVMKSKKIHEALTGDHHFKQAGFTILM